jgi:4-hydroxy-3-methylbut-2-enyl diphosphate reductase
VAVVIETARHAGACYGVERALRLVGECAASRPCVSTLGPLIHNPQAVAQLARRGVAAVERVDDVRPGGTVVIRSHGVVPQVVERARELGLEVVDATCPHVKKAHEGAARLAADGFQVVVVGEAGHPEVEGILARAGRLAAVVGTPDEAARVPLACKKVGVVVQTTQSQALLAQVVAALTPRARELRVLNTICAATVQRQQAAAELAARADAMVVVGGRNSGNTRRLAQVCAASCPDTHHVEKPDELRAAWFAGARLVGVTAGASTPADQVEAVVEAVRALTAEGEEGR